ncbi:MAG: DUF3015 family protein [Bdellovibrionaceae bacterium]|nr:DUF3015 family protein [Pseudobdellovibrionaceae bacterium]MBX3034086.1 DUF3015 family protein [Pseudobdellovibrionaceae bacterium]
MKSILFSLVTLFAGSAMAAAYGDSGCGLGAMVMGSEKGLKQVLASTTNGTSGSQTFGITTGTSNCTEGGIFKSAEQVPAYIELNKIALAKEAARGEGETLAGLSQLMGCETVVFGKTVKANYNTIFVESKMEATEIRNRIQSATHNVCGA